MSPNYEIKLPQYKKPKNCVILQKYARFYNKMQYLAKKKKCEKILIDFTRFYLNCNIQQGYTGFWLKVQKFA